MFYGHRCTRCHHADWWSPTSSTPGSSIDADDPKLRRKQCGAGQVCGRGACARDGCAWDPHPVPFRRFDNAGRDVVDHVPPGVETTGTGHNRNRIHACVCARCVDLYRTTVDRDFTYTPEEATAHG